MQFLYLILFFLLYRSIDIFYQLQLCKQELARYQEHELTQSTFEAPQQHSDNGADGQRDESQCLCVVAPEV